MRTKQVACVLTRGKAAGDEAEITITTPALDLMRDRIHPMKMETDSYMTGPRAVNFAHDHLRLPVARTMTLSKNPTGIRARFRWRNDEDSQKVKEAFDDGVLGASVEFTVPDGGAVRNADGGWDFVKSILTGWAFTGNPANLACSRMFKSLGLLEEPVLEVLDWDGPGASVQLDVRAAVRAAAAAGCAAGVSRAFGPQDFIEVTDWSPPGADGIRPWSQRVYRDDLLAEFLALPLDEQKRILVAAKETGIW